MYEQLSLIDPANNEEQAPHRLGWGPNEYRSVGPGWVENDEGEVLPPETGETYDTNPGLYASHLRGADRQGEKVRQHDLNMAGIAACREALGGEEFFTP